MYKTITFTAMAFLVVTGVSLAAEQTWTGVISDTMCAKSHQSNIEHARGNSGKTMTEKECTVGCVAHRGQKYVLVSGGKIYEIENQDYAGLPVYAAERVTLTGRLTGNSINVSGIVGAERPKGR